MTLRHVFGEHGRPDRFYVDGEQVTKEEYEKHLPPPAERGIPMAGVWKRPVISEAMAVHPDQIPEAMERDKKHGLNVEYTPEGQPIIRSSAEKRAMAKSLGLHDRNCFS